MIHLSMLDKGAYSTMFWFGPRGCISPLHYDPLDNLLMQFVGSKKVILFPATSASTCTENVKNAIGDANRDANTNLWHYAGHNGQQYNTSPIDLLNPDFEKFPLFVNAPTAICCDLEPGDICFIPQRWWHHVTSLDTSISVNAWWRWLVLWTMKACAVIDTIRRNARRQREHNITPTQDTNRTVISTINKTNLVSILETTHHSKWTPQLYVTNSTTTYISCNFMDSFYGTIFITVPLFSDTTIYSSWTKLKLVGRLESDGFDESNSVCDSSDIVAAGSTLGKWSVTLLSECNCPDVRSNGERCWGFDNFKPYGSCGND